MIKFVVSALWISAATVGAVFWSFQNSGKSDEAAPAPALFGGLDYVKTDIITVPVVRDAKVDGYFIARLVFTAEAARLNKLSVPATALITDEVYSYLYSTPQIDFTGQAPINIDKFRQGVRDAVNARAGEKLIHEVLVEQVDFLTKDEIRNHPHRRRKAATQGNPAPETSP